MIGNISFMIKLVLLDVNFVNAFMFYIAYKYIYYFEDVFFICWIS